MRIYGKAMSSIRVSLVDICFYGQKKDDSWFREDVLFPLDVTINSIELCANEIFQANELSYISWGLDSKIFQMDGITGEVAHVGNLLFIDFDGGITFDSLLMKIAYLKRDKCFVSNPDIVNSGNGFHVYVFERLSFDVVKKALVSDYIYSDICDKFFRTTMLLKSSVLRLSSRKKGIVQPVKVVEYGYTNDLIGGDFSEFVRRAIDENSRRCI